VIDRKDYFEVACYEGSVQVQSSGAVVQLFPKQMFRIAGGMTIKEKIATGNSPAWMVNESSFQSVPFIFAIREFERQYNVTVTTRNVDTAQLFTGTFTHSDLSLALKSITIPLNLTYHITEDKKIILTGD
jgi:transmembrane sensor